MSTYSQNDPWISVAHWNPVFKFYNLRVKFTIPTHVILFAVNWSAWLNCFLLVMYCRITQETSPLMRYGNTKPLTIHNNTKPHTLLAQVCVDKFQAFWWSQGSKRIHISLYLLNNCYTAETAKLTSRFVCQLENVIPMLHPTALAQNDHRSQQATNFIHSFVGSIVQSCIHSIQLLIHSLYLILVFYSTFNQYLWIYAF